MGRRFKPKQVEAHTDGRQRIEAFDVQQDVAGTPEVMQPPVIRTCSHGMSETVHAVMVIFKSAGDNFLTFGLRLEWGVNK